MKVLIVADIHTHPHNRGNLQGVYRECCQMKKMGWQIDFLFWGDRLDADLDAMERFLGKDHLFFANTTGGKFEYRLYSHIRRRMDRKGATKYIALPYAVDEYYDRGIEEKVKLLHDRNHYDVVWLEYYLQSKVFCGLDEGIVKVIHTHDKFTNRNKIFQKEGKIPEFYYLTRRGERKALARADVVIAVQDMERDFFSDLLKNTGTITMTVGNLVELRESRPVEAKNYGFLGAVNEANRYALEYFIDKILPLVKEKEPESKFLIAGGICNTVPDSDDYTKLGFVKELEDFYNQVMFVVGPLKNGTGLNIKNIEALSYGKPVVTTSVGAKGLKGAKGAVCVCDEAEGFAEMTVQLLGDSVKRSEMGRKAVEFITAYNEQNLGNYVQIEQIVEERKAGRAV